MASILKVDTIQDQDGNNIINENADTITIGASGDTITIPSGATLTNNGTQTGLTLSDNILFNTASKGIYLGVTSATASNLLDDYEEGTWTPVIQGSTTAGTGTYSLQNGTYTKVGNVVSFRFLIVYSSHTGTGFLKIGGLPFTANNTTYYVIQTENISLDAGKVAFTARIDNGTTSGFMLESPTGGGTRSAITFDSAGDVSGAGIYMTDA